MLGEGGGGGWVGGGFGWLEVHAFDEAVGDGVDVPDLAIGKDVAGEALDELMHFDVGDAGFAVDHFDGIDVRIKLLPLAGPVGANLLFAVARPPSEALGQLTFSLMSARAASISRRLKAA